MTPHPRTRVTRSRHTIAVTPPYRLDLTVSVLRRLSGNVVDVITPEGEYMRAFAEPGGALVVRVRQLHPGKLSVTLEGNQRQHRRVLELVRRMLGVDRELAHFQRAAARIPWLKPLVKRMRGVRPPRYPSLWEACVNAIVFQQISLQSAAAIMRRFVLALSPPVESSGVLLYPFPTLASMQRAQDSTLRVSGLSLSKLATLRRLSDALATGTLTEALLEERPSAEAAALLRKFKGIGPWTAAVILLRGLGRLDVFPGNDTSVARNLALVSGSARIDLDQILRALSPQQGMLYYYLLLARLEARDDVGRASVRE